MSWWHCPHCDAPLMQPLEYGLAECENCGGAFVFDEGDRLGPDSMRPVSSNPPPPRQSNPRKPERKRGQGTVE